jgi:hypothetical protein
VNYSHTPRRKLLECFGKSSLTINKAVYAKRQFMQSDKYSSNVRRQVWVEDALFLNFKACNSSEALSFILAYTLYT